MKRMFGFVILALTVLMYVPSVAAQTSTQDSLAPSPNVLALPPGNNWLLSSWVCVPADCFDIVVAKEYGYASTIAFGTCYGTPSTGAHNPVAAEAIEASGCESPVYWRRNSDISTDNHGFCECHLWLGGADSSCRGV